MQDFVPKLTVDLVIEQHCLIAYELSLANYIVGTKATVTGPGIERTGVKLDRTGSLALEGEEQDVIDFFFNFDGVVVGTDVQLDASLNVPISLDEYDPANS